MNVSMDIKPIRLFYSYAHADESYRIQLEKHLSTLRRQGVIKEWHDRQIIPGQNWVDEIDENLEKADVILLLISVDFVSSDYCYEVEMKRAFERHKQGVAKVIPILLRSTDLEGTPFVKLQGLPTHLKPVENWEKKDDAYCDIVKGLRNLIKEMQAKSTSSGLEQSDSLLLSEESIVSGLRDVSDNSVSNDDFVCKMREKIKIILSTGKPAALVLREALLKDKAPNFAPEEVLLPKNTPVSPELSIRELRKTVLACLPQAHTNVTEIKQCATEIMGWLILLCVYGIHDIDIDQVDEIVVPYKNLAGTEVFVARLHQRPASFLLNGQDKVSSEGHVFLGEIELGLLKPDHLLEIKKLIYSQVFPGEKPVASDDWTQRLRKTLDLRAEDDRKMYYFSLPFARRSELVDTIKQLKTCLPKLQILITGTSEDGSMSVGIMAEGELEALVLHFLNALSKFP